LPLQALIHIKKSNGTAKRLLQFLQSGLMILLGCIYTSNALAGTTVSLYESYAGNLSFELTGGSFRTTQNDVSACTTGTSSSNRMDTIPTGSTIKKAYLYWASSSSNTTADSQVVFNNQTITANRTYSHYTGTWYFTSAVADVTTLVSSTRNGNYTMTGLDIYSTNAHCTTQVTLGGWALMVIYEDDAEDFRVLNIYEGFEYFRNNSLTLNPDNFVLPTNPNGKHAHITWEGDDSLGGTDEFLTFENNALGSQPFDSYSNIQGGLTTYGVDVDEYDISSYLTAGDTQVSTTYSAGQDGVLLSAEIMSVSNIPVADLAVTTSDPTGWQQGSTVTKKYTISNNGPDDVPTDSVRFTTTLPTGVSFTGTQGDSDWVCTPNPNTGQTISCIYQNKLRSGWSDYLDLSFAVDNGIAGSNLTIDVAVDHDLAPYDIFDNHADSDNYAFTVPINTDATTDLSASSKTYTNLSGDLLLAGDTLQYTITIKDASGVAATDIQVTDDLPANISGFNILSFPSGATNSSSASGGTNGTGYINIQGIDLATSTEEEIVIEVFLDANTAEGTSLQNTASIIWDDTSPLTWVVDTGDITVVKPDLSVSLKDAEDINGGWLLPNETVRYTITLDDDEELDLTGLQVTDHLPANISSFSVISIPSGATDFSLVNGGLNGTGFIDIRNINLASSSTEQIIIEAIVDGSAPDAADFKNTATILLSSASWSIESNDLNITLSSSAPASGNKPLYLASTALNNRALTRNLPSTNTEQDFLHGDTLTWTLNTNLQSDLELAAGDIRFNMAVEGYRTGSITTQFTATLYYNDNIGGGNIVIATEVIPYGNYRINTIYDVFADLPLAADLTIPQGSTIYLNVYNQSSNSTANQYSQIDVQTFNSTFYSAVVLNANTVINVDSITVWDQPYGDPLGSGDGAQLDSSQPDTSLYIRANISDPFGAFDISSAQIAITKTDTSSYDFSAHPDGNQDLMTQVDTTTDDETSNTKIYEKEITLLEAGESIGWWQISVTGFEGFEVAPDQVTHERIDTFKITPFLPSIALSKSITVVNDPVNLTVNPKAIPGAELTYTIKAVNTGRGKSDDASIIIEDEIPENSELYINDLSCNNSDPEFTMVNNNNGPVCFLTGATPNESGLSLNFASLKDSNDNIWFAKADKDFSYEPDDTTDYDAAIRFIRIKLDGELNNQAKGSTDEPKFGLTYKVMLN
jgi:uncharacterized repeat protein (TIGR01451 family)